MKNSKEKKVSVTVTIMVALFFAISTVQAISSDPVGLKRSIGYAFLGLAFILVAIAYAYIFITRRREREKRREKEIDEVEAVIRILKEARKIKEEIEKRGENLTSGAEIILSRIEFRIDGLNDRLAVGVNDLKSLMLFGIGILLGTMLALALAIISMT